MLQSMWIGPLFWFVLLFVCIVIVGLRGGTMEKPARLAQLYAYAVCLIAVVTCLISLAGFANAIIDLSNPLYGNAFGQPAISSFEAYQATVDRSSTAAQADTASEATLRARYEALRADRIARVTFESKKSMVVSGLILIFAVALFTLHWRWARSFRAADQAA